MYERIRSGGKYRGNWPMYPLVALCVLILSLIIGLIIWACMGVVHFRAFVSDFSNSTTHAYQNHCLRITTDEGEYLMKEEHIYTVYTRITNAGPGRVCNPPAEEPGAVLDFGDGSYMELWKVELENPSNGKKYGLFISYVNQTGERYSYDTDRLELGVLPLNQHQNLPNRMK